MLDLYHGHFYALVDVVTRSFLPLLLSDSKPRDATRRCAAFHNLTRLYLSFSRACECSCLAGLASRKGQNFSSF